MIQFGIGKLRKPIPLFRVSTYTPDLSVFEHIKDFVGSLEQQTLNRINEGVEVRGEAYYACCTDYFATANLDDIQSTLAGVNATHLILLLMENNKGENFKANGIINIHICTPTHSFEGYTDLCLSEEGAGVVAPMEWQAFEGNVGYFK